MKLLLPLTIILIPYILVGQDTITKILIDSSLLYTPQSDPSKIKVSSVVLHPSPKTKYASCAYFYTEPEMNIKAKGKINTDEKKVGTWRYFYKNGNLLGVAHFSKAGNKIGIWKYYKSNGVVDKKIIIKNDKFGILKSHDRVKTKIPIEEIKEPLILKKYK